MTQHYFGFDGSRDDIPRVMGFLGDPDKTFWVDEIHSWGFSATGSRYYESFAEQVRRQQDEPRLRVTYTTTSQRVDGPLAVTDGSISPDRVLYTWPMILRRAKGPFEEQLFEAHRPHMKVERGLPWCWFCESIWPCDNAAEILRVFGLTEHDFDFRPEDNGGDGRL